MRLIVQPHRLAWPQTKNRAKGHFNNVWQNILPGIYLFLEFLMKKYTVYDFSETFPEAGHYLWTGNFHENIFELFKRKALYKYLLLLYYYYL